MLGFRPLLFTLLAAAIGTIVLRLIDSLSP